MRNLMRVLVLIAALSIVALGFLTACVTIMVGFLGPEADRLTTITFAVSLMILTVGLGLAMAWHAWRAIQGYPSVPFRPRVIWPLSLAFVLALGIGQLILSLNLTPLITFPILHAAAAVLPPLIIVALVSRNLGGSSSARDVVLQMGSGAFVSGALAFALEGLALLGLVVAVLFGLALGPDGQQMLQTLQGNLNNPAWLQDPALLTSALRSPLLVAAVFVVLAGLIPLIEEAVKTVGVGLMAYRRPTLSQAFLWGLAGGAGFSLVEGLLNTASGLDTWAQVMLLRVGATLLHCLTGGLMGLAWYQVLARRRWLYALGMYAASVAIHGTWNTLAGALALLSLRALGANLAASQGVLSGLGAIVLLGLMAGLAVAMALVLRGTTLYVRRNSSDPVRADLRPDYPSAESGPVEGPTS
jgi:PrsW family intramembrane metalloprotease